MRCLDKCGKLKLYKYGSDGTAAAMYNIATLRAIKQELNNLEASRLLEDSYRELHRKCTNPQETYKSKSASANESNQGFDFHLKTTKQVTGPAISFKLT